MTPLGRGRPECTKEQIILLSPRSAYKLTEARLIAKEQREYAAEFKLCKCVETKKRGTAFVVSAGELWSRRGTDRRRRGLSNRFPVDHQLYPTVSLPPLRGVIRCHWLRFAESARGH
jgi:hypothetical protein